MGERLRAMRAEGRKAASPLLLAVLVVFGLSVWRDLETTVAFYADQSRAASVARIDLEHRVERACTTPVTDPAACVLARRDLRDNRPLLANGRAMGPIAAALATPAGVVRFVAHQLTSGIGWLLVAAVASVLVVGERTRGTAEEAIRQQGRRPYLAAKFAAVVLAVGAIAATTAGVLVLLRTTTRAAATVATGMDARGRIVGARAVAADPRWASGRGALAAVLAALAVVLVVAAIAVPLAAWCRSRSGFGVGALAVVAITFAASRSTHGGALAPMTILDRALHLGGTPPDLRDVRIWDTSSRPGDVLELRSAPSPSWAALVALVVTAMAVAIAATRLFVARGPRR